MTSSESLPEPVCERWQTHAVEGVIGVRIAGVEGDRLSASEWVWSSTWYDVVSAR